MRTMRDRKLYGRAEASRVNLIVPKNVLLDAHEKSAREKCEVLLGIATIVGGGKVTVEVIHFREGADGHIRYCVKGAKAARRAFNTVGMNRISFTITVTQQESVEESGGAGTLDDSSKTRTLAPKDTPSDHPGDPTLDGGDLEFVASCIRTEGDADPTRAPKDGLLGTLVATMPRLRPDMDNLAEEGIAQMKTTVEVGKNDI